MYKSLTPNMMVTDVNATVKWYQDNFNFKFANKGDGLDTPLDWAIVEADGVEIFFQKVESLTEEMPVLKGKEIGASLTLYIRVADVESLYKSVKEKVKIVRDMKETFYGAKEFAVRDLNGYILVFSEIEG
ncbi:bleomycin resistance family protein [Candidatus Peregrinibacteria bacterium]|jgi:lactoylglutathione lyase|nr:bleomycin resistance family protein [Candidatus Peregrinibacteria bacterium]